MAEKTPSLLSAETIRGSHVRNTQGDDLGTIKQVMIDLSEGHVAYAVLSFGGFLGIGARMVAIPWDAFRPSSHKDEYVTHLSKELIKEAPTFDKDKWPGGADRSFLSNLYTYYGFTPYWGADANLETRTFSADAGGGKRMEVLPEEVEPLEVAPMAGVEPQPVVVETVTETIATEYEDLGEARGLERDDMAVRSSSDEGRSAWAGNTGGISGGAGDTDADIREPGTNVRSSDSPASETPAPSTEHAYGGRSEATEGGPSQSREACEGSNIYGGVGWTTGGSGSAQSGQPYRGGGDLEPPRNSADWLQDTGEHGRTSGFEDENMNSSKSGEGMGRYMDTSGADEVIPDIEEPTGRTRRLDESPTEEIPEGQGDTKAFEAGEEYSAVSGFGSTHDIVNMSGASGPSAAGATGGSEGMSAAEDLSIGSVDDLNTMGTTLGLDREAGEEEVTNEDVELPNEGGRRGSSYSGDPRTNEDDTSEDESDPTRSGRGHSTGQTRDSSSAIHRDADDEGKLPPLNRG